MYIFKVTEITNRRVGWIYIYEEIKLNKSIHFSYTNVNSHFWVYVFTYL